MPRICGISLPFIFAWAHIAVGQEAQSNVAPQTTTPIKHVIVIVGENRTFDHVFATYQPKAGETIDNLLSRQIVNVDGTLGPNYSRALQYSAVDHDEFLISPGFKTPYQHLPPPLTGGPTSPFFTTAQQVNAGESALPQAYQKYLLTGGTGLAPKTVDSRIKNVTTLPPGPFQLTSNTLPYDAYTASPVHRFFEMWQQLDCDLHQADNWDPVGCRSDLFAWVEVSVGPATSGATPPPQFTNATTGEGGTALGFYNMAAGDAPYLKHLADKYAISDNYHQPVNGGTGVNHMMLGTGDVLWFSDGKGNPATPPSNDIENPNPVPNSNNWYEEAGDGSGGGHFINCADASQPGVAPILNFLASLPYRTTAHCQSGHYYVLDNLSPGYFGDGTLQYAPGNWTIPPSNIRTIGDALLKKQISFAYYGDHFKRYVNHDSTNRYCEICNFFQYSSSLMTNASVRGSVLRDTTDLDTAISTGTLPAVSFVKPSGWVDGHPKSSKLILFEGFVKKIVDEVQANPALWQNTAILITFDEGGGYYDSGYVQPIDFFGDGPRIPLIVVSPYAKPGHVSHDYADHVSILKFIERNWALAPLTQRSRDNLPDPTYDITSTYVPNNSPAIGDLFDLFQF